MKKLFFPIMGILCLCSTLTMAQSVINDSSWTSARPDGHAPISVMGDHYHKKGEFMFSYRYMPMVMKDNLAGSDNSSDETIFQNYMVSAQKMNMEMHMLGMMYAPSSNFTLSLMVNYIDNSMDLQTRMGEDFTTESSGFGDLTLGGIIKIVNANRQAFHGNIGVSIPTGDLDQRGDTPMMANAKLAYPMQLGSGTFDPYVGLTYLGQNDLFSWGAQSLYKLRVGENDENYRLGNTLDAVAWAAIKASELLSFSSSLSYEHKGEIHGQDSDMNPMMMPAFNTMNSGRSQVDLGVGTNFYLPNGTFKNLRLAAEFKLPIVQNVEGIQAENKWMATFGIQYSFGH